MELNENKDGTWTSEGWKPKCNTRYQEEKELWYEVKIKGDLKSRFFKNMAEEEKISPKSWIMQEVEAFDNIRQANKLGKAKPYSGKQIYYFAINWLETDNEIRFEPIISRLFESYNSMVKFMNQDCDNVNIKYFEIELQKPT